MLTYTDMQEPSKTCKSINAHLKAGLIEGWNNYKEELHVCLAQKKGEGLCLNDAMGACITQGIKKKRSDSASLHAQSLVLNFHFMVVHVLLDLGISVCHFLVHAQTSHKVAKIQYPECVRSYGTARWGSQPAAAGPSWGLSEDVGFSSRYTCRSHWPSGEKKLS